MQSRIKYMYVGCVLYLILFPVMKDTSNGAIHGTMLQSGALTFTQKIGIKRFHIHISCCLILANDVTLIRFLYLVYIL